MHKLSHQDQATRGRYEKLRRRLSEIISVPYKISTATLASWHKSGNGYTWKISDFAFLSDSAEALALLNAHHIPVFIVTNQSGIARGYFSETDMHKFNQHLIEQVDLKGGRITDIAFCPHHPDYPKKDAPTHCGCRKPSSGMLQKLSHKWQIDLKKSVMVGDQQTDVQAGIKGIAVRAFC